jgi:hypothetical protein
MNDVMCRVSKPTERLIIAYTNCILGAVGAESASGWRVCLAGLDT